MPLINTLVKFRQRGGFACSCKCEFDLKISEDTIFSYVKKINKKQKNLNHATIVSFTFLLVIQITVQF